jgi:hypothetical protein
LADGADFPAGNIGQPETARNAGPVDAAADFCSIEQRCLPSLRQQAGKFDSVVNASSAGAISE